MKFTIKILIGIIFLYSTSVFAQKDTIYTFGDETEDIEYFFGFSLIPSAMGGLVHFALIKPGSEKNTVKQITRDDFIAQSSGKQKSIANPKFINLFKQYQIDNPNIIDELWRLRYKEYPYFTSEKMQPGWSANDSIPMMPTITQMETLKKFGLYRMSDYIYGENAFKLLYLIGKPEWVNTYKASY